MATHSSVLVWRIPGTAGPGGLRSMGSHRVGHDWSDLAAAAEGYGNQYWPICSSVLAWRTPLPDREDREDWQATVYRVTKSWTRLKQSCMDRHKTFFNLWQLCPSESWAWKCHNCLAFGDPGSAKYAGTWTASTAEVMALSVSFFQPLVAGLQKAYLASLSL